MKTKRWFAGLVYLSLLVLVTACSTVSAAQQQQAVPVRADSSANIELISNYLREANSPEQFLNHFADVLKNRNGAVARLFLKPELQNEIKAQVIGVSTPLSKIDIKAIDSKQYTLSAYFGPYDQKKEQLAFEWRVSVEPEGTTGRYFITSIERVQDKTGGAW